ncbi:MAG: prepilin-type N-terminal cleavage/methylation domain-containing protein [Phycisphaeraceae bacterium]|nr:prepilin-type N-terminal cleavage/methylation domain-containing protein [Phycisphaeraceae bacterium]
MSGIQAIDRCPLIHHRRRRAARRRGLTLMELLVALPIIALLLTATMVAIDVSFQAYSSAAREAATQASTRMVVHRLLTLVRTSTAHEPLNASGDALWPVTTDGDLLTSGFITLIDPRGDEIRIEFRQDIEELWAIRTTPGGTVTMEPILGNVESAVFTSRRRLDRTGVFVLERATMDIAVRSDQEGILTVEGRADQPVRFVASTAPRKID